jgi:1,4-dihydroxy-2-naphthoate octaprenyltransferase
MDNEELLQDSDQKSVSRPKATSSTKIVTAEAVQAEEVPTLPLGPVESISALEPEIAVRSVAATPVVSTPEPLVVQPSEYHRSAGEWVQIWKDGIRPAYLPLSLMPVLLGSTLAWTQTITSKAPFGQFHLTHFIGTVLAVFLLQAGASLVNDYYDYVHGIDTSNSLGPGGLIQQGLVKPTRVLSVGFAALAIGAILGLIVALRGGPLVVLFGLIGLLCAYFYSATKRSLSSLALGELVGFIIFGPLITLGAYMVQTGGIGRNVLIYSIPLGLLAAAIIHVNNMRDLESDAQSNKRTIAALLGVTWGRAWFLALVLAAYIIILMLGIPRGTPHLILITFWTLPSLAVVVTGIVRSDVSPGFHLVMKELLKLETGFGLLLAIALIVTALIPVMPVIPFHLLNLL